MVRFMKTKAIFRSLFTILFLLLLVGTVVLMLVIPPMEDARKREELGDPLAFVTSTARTPWAYVDAEGALRMYPEDCVGLTVLRIPEAVNGVTVTGVSAAFSHALTDVERIILPSTAPVPVIDRSLSSWSALRQLVFREGCADLSRASVKAVTQLEEIYLPKSIEKIGWHFLREGDGTPTVYYAGTEEEWLSLGADAKRVAGRYTMVYETSAPVEWIESTK